MAPRALGALLALAAAALFVVSIATSSWWAGHPIVKGMSWDAKDVHVGLLGATGCNTGGDGTCEAIETGSLAALAGYGELAATGLATILVLALAISAWKISDRRRGVARASLVCTLLAAAGAGVVVLLGPDIKTAEHVEIPIGYGLYLFGGAIVSSVIATLITRKLEPEPLRLKSSVPVMPSSPFEVRQQILATPSHVTPARDSAPMLEDAPQLRPLYDPMNAGVVPAPPPPALPLHAPTVPRSSVPVLTGMATPPPVIEPRATLPSTPPSRATPFPRASTLEAVLPPPPPPRPHALTPRPANISSPPPAGAPPSAAPPSAGPPSAPPPSAAPPPYAPPSPSYAPRSRPAPILRPPPSASRPPPSASRLPPSDSRLPPLDSRLPPSDSRPPPSDSRPPPSDSRPPPSDSRRPPSDSRPPVGATRLPAKTIPPALGRVPMPARTNRPSNPTLSHAIPPMPTPENTPPPAVLPAPGTLRATTEVDDTLEAAMRQTDHITTVDIDSEAKAAHEERVTAQRTAEMDAQVGESTEVGIAPAPIDPVHITEEQVAQVDPMATTARDPKPLDLQETLERLSHRKTDPVTPVPTIAARAQQQAAMSTASALLPPPKSVEASTGPRPACPQCEAPMAWVDEHLRFYCKSCRMYF